MKRHAVIPAAVGLGFAVSAGFCAWLLATDARGLTPATMLLDINFLSKLLLLPAIILYPPILGLGLFEVAIGRGRLGLPLAILGAVSAALGLLAGGWVLISLQQILAAVGPAPFQIVAAQYAEASFSAALGLGGATIAFFARWIGLRKR